MFLPKNVFNHEIKNAFFFILQKAICYHLPLFRFWLEINKVWPNQTNKSENMSRNNIEKSLLIRTIFNFVMILSGL